MVLYFIGLGLGDEKDITVKGLEYIKSSHKVFLESYTSVLSVDVKKLEEFYGKEVHVCWRETVEIEMDEILKEVKENQPDKNYSFLVVGDPFCATTHSDLFLRAIKLGKIQNRKKRKNSKSWKKWRKTQNFTGLEIRLEPLLLFFIHRALIDPFCHLKHLYFHKTHFPYFSSKLLKTLIFPLFCDYDP